MVYTNKLTTAKKDKFFPELRKRDGDVCFYCEMPFTPEIFGLGRNFDHLNNNPDDNRIQNLVLAHFDCNQKKKSYIDWQILAKEKLERNESSCESQRVRERKSHEQTDTDIAELNEGDINYIVNKIVKAELDTKLPPDSTKTTSYTETLRGIHYLLIQQTGGRGSEQAVRRALDTYCHPYSKWGDKKAGRGNRVIFRRKEGDSS